MPRSYRRRPGPVPVLTPEELESLSTAALRSRLSALQRMPERMPDHVRAAARIDQPVIAIWCKGDPLWREAYRAVKTALSLRQGLAMRQTSDA